MIVLYLILSAAFASAPKVYLQPVEIVEDTPIDSFSDRTDGWPVEKISKDLLTPDTSLFDSLNRYPSLFSKGGLSSGSPNISIRGSSDYSRTLVLYDGIQLNARDGLGANPLLILTENLSQIHILKGPASVYYGPDAVGGAINLIPEQIKRPKIRGGIGSFGNRTAYFGSPIIDNDFNHIQMSGFLSNTDGSFNYDQDGYSGVRNNNNNATQKINVEAQQKFARSLLKENLVYAQEFGASPGPINNSISPTYYNRTATLFSFLAEHTFDERTKLSYRISNVSTENFNQSSGVTTRWFSNEMIDATSFEKKLTEFLSAQVFLDYFHNTFENKPAVSKQNDVRVEPGLIFKYTPDSQYLVTPGIRYLPSEGKFVKSILVSQEFTLLKNWISYSEAFRSPTFTQKYWNDSSYIGNPNLTPEQSYQIEAGLANKSGLSFLAYSTRYDNYIQFVSGTPSTYQNSGSANVFGIDLEAGLAPSIWTFVFKYSYMSTQIIQTNTEMPLSPHNRASLIMGLQLGPFITEIQNTYWDRYYLSATQIIDPWIVTDLNFRTVGMANWAFKAGIQNILDVKRVYTALYPEPGRSFYANIERSF